MPKKNNVNELPFKIGSDPEFLMFFGIRGLDARNIMRSFFRNTNLVEEDNGFAIENVGNFGWDGASSTGELRPVASNNIDTMVSNLGTMLTQIATKIPSVDITSLSIGSPIGGHIHVDDFTTSETSREIGSTTPSSATERNRVELTLASYLLPITASDHRVSALNRLSNSTYGLLTDFRYEHKNGVVTCEIRGLTGEWLSSPEIAKATFAYIATVYHELAKRNLELSRDDFVCKNKSQCNNLQRMMLADYKIIERGICQSIKKKIKTFELYPQFKKEIDFILNPSAVLKHKSEIGWNIRRGWNLENGTKPSKKQLMSSTVVREILQKENIPDVKNHFGLSYNGDYNVESFSNAIAERIAALNWQLKNDYFLFGFKKGVEGYAARTPDGLYYCVPTNQETSTTGSICCRMSNRIEGRNITRIDPKTGLIRKAQSSGKIVIGIPYSDRELNNPKKLIDLIYKIENKKIQPFSLETFEHVVVLNKEEKVNLNSIVENDTDEIDFDELDVTNVIRELENI